MSFSFAFFQCKRPSTNSVKTFKENSIVVVSLNRIAVSVQLIGQPTFRLLVIVSNEYLRKDLHVKRGS